MGYPYERPNALVSARQGPVARTLNVNEDNPGAIRFCESQGVVTLDRPQGRRA